MTTLQECIDTYLDRPDTSSLEEGRFDYLGFDDDVELVHDKPFKGTDVRVFHSPDGFDDRDAGPRDAYYWDTDGAGGGYAHSLSRALGDAHMSISKAH